MNKQIQNIVTEMIDGINYQQMIGGEIFLNLKDVAIGLGFERERERNGNITKTIRWDNIKKYFKSRKTKRDGCEKRNAFIETKTKCASNLIRKVTAYLQNQSKTPSLYIKINGIQMDF